MIANREDVVQAALTVERWCAENKGCIDKDRIDCPFVGRNGMCTLIGLPDAWNLAEKLRTRGLKHD